MVISLPAARYEVPSKSLVKDPVRPNKAFIDPEAVTSPPKTDDPLTDVFLLPIAPDTKKNTSVPILVGT